MDDTEVGGPPVLARCLVVLLTALGPAAALLLVVLAADSWAGCLLCDDEQAPDRVGGVLYAVVALAVLCSGPVLAAWELRTRWWVLGSVVVVSCQVIWWVSSYVASLG